MAGAGGPVPGRQPRPPTVEQVCSSRMRRPANQETLGVSCGRSSGKRPWRAFSMGSRRCV